VGREGADVADGIDVLGDVRGQRRQHSSDLVRQVVLGGGSRLDLPSSWHRAPCGLVSRGVFHRDNRRCGGSASSV
jgi:hypothetical protein